MMGARVIATLAVFAMAPSTTVVVSASSSDCERVVVQAQSSDHVEHTGTFYQVGTALDDTPLFKSDGGYCLMFIGEGSIADEDYSTFIDLDADTEGESGDGSLDVELPAVEASSRRSLQRCGYWVIGRMGPADTAMYPMLKVADCADHPAFIDEDLSWFRQDCHECEQDFDIGYVDIYTESYACDSFTWAPASTPTPAAGDVEPTGGDGGGIEPTTPVFPLSPTAPPAETGGEDASTGGEDAETGGEDASTGGEDAETGDEDAGTGDEDAGTGGEDASSPETGAEDGGDGEDGSDEDERSSVDLETAGDTDTGSDDGVDGVAVGVGVGVGVAVLGVIALVVIKKAKS